MKKNNKKTSDVADLFDRAPFKSWLCIKEHNVLGASIFIHRTMYFLLNSAIFPFYLKILFIEYSLLRIFYIITKDRQLSRPMKHDRVLLCQLGATCLGAHSVPAKKLPFMKGPKHHHPVSCVCPQFRWPLPKAAMSQFCAMPAGERKKHAAAICREVHGTNGMVRSPQRRSPENIHSDLGSKCHGCSLALSINKPMERFTTYGGKILCRSPFRPSISGGRREAARGATV